jgi:hypothetical protein
MTAMSSGTGVPEVDFGTGTICEAVMKFFASGCVLLRRFCDPQALQRLRSQVQAIHDEIDFFHVTHQDFHQRGLKSPSEYLWSDDYDRLLRAVFGKFDFRNLHDTSRHIDPLIDPEKEEAWQAPLVPHIDAFVHPRAFTVNFWLPLQRCDADTPRLGVVPAAFSEVLQFLGLRGRAEWRDPDDYGPHLDAFRPEIQAIWDCDPGAVARFREHFAGRLQAPIYELGDAMMLSNWSLHYTHADAGMGTRRESLELRFVAAASLDDILDARGRGPAAACHAQI